MAAKGYCAISTTGPVAQYYGSDLTPAQAALAAAWLEEAEQEIDAATGRPFGTGPLTGEVYAAAYGPVLYLRERPVASIESITAYRTFSATGVVLTPGTDYELRDATSGQVVVGVGFWGGVGAAYWTYYRIAYTPVATIPAAISAATAALLADRLARAGTSLNSGAVIGKKVGDVEVRYSAETPGAQSTELPRLVRQLLTPYVRPVRFA